MGNLTGPVNENMWLRISLGRRLLFWEANEIFFNYFPLFYELRNFVFQGLVFLYRDARFVLCIELVYASDWPP